MSQENTVYLFEDCGASFAESVRNLSKFRDCVILRTESFDDGAPNLYSFFTTIARQHSLLKNWQTTFISYKEFFESLKVVLSRLNHLSVGEFNVAASDVITTQSKYFAGEATKNVGAYEYYLDECNCLDQYGLLRLLESNRDVLAATLSTSFLIEGVVRTSWQQAAINFLSKGKALKKIQTETPIDDAVPCILEDQITFENDPTVLPKEDRLPKFSQSLEYTIAILKSFISLLINSRDEMAISSALACPLIKLSHEAFTAIKRAASAAKSPIYQFILSFVTKRKLAGAKASPANCPVSLYAKELGCFVDIMDKLQTFIEESASSKQAVTKITTSILNRLAKEIPTLTIKSQMIEQCRTLITTLIHRIETSGSIPDDSINKNIIGREAIWMLRTLSDHLSSLGFHQKPSKLLCSPFSAATPSRTPVGAQTLFKLFKSPAEKFIDDEDCVPLSERAPEPVAIQKPRMPFSVAYDPEVPKRFEDEPLARCLSPETPVAAPAVREIQAERIELTPINNKAVNKRRGVGRDVGAKKRLKLVSADDPENKASSKATKRTTAAPKKTTAPPKKSTKKIVPPNQKSINSFFSKV